MLLLNPTHLFLMLALHFCDAEISNQRLCGDPLCQEPVSFAKTLLRYASDDTKILSFPPNVEAKVFSKSAGTRLDLWGVEINGKKGYAPKEFLREHRILKSKLEHTVSTDEVEAYPALGVSAQTPTQNQNDPFEVVDGTTLFYSTSGSSRIELQATPTLTPDVVSATSQLLELNRSNKVDEERDNDMLELIKDEGSTEDLLLEVEILENGDQEKTNDQMVEGKGVEAINGKEVEPVEGKEVEPVEGKEEEPVEGKEVEPIEGKEVEPVEGKEEEPVEGKDDEEGSAIYRYISSLLPVDVTNQISGDNEQEESNPSEEPSQIIDEVMEGGESIESKVVEKENEDEVLEDNTLDNNIEEQESDITTDNNIDQEIQDTDKAKEIEVNFLEQNLNSEQAQVEQVQEDNSTLEIEPITEEEDHSKLEIEPKTEEDDSKLEIEPKTEEGNSKFKIELKTEGVPLKTERKEDLTVVDQKNQGVIEDNIIFEIDGEKKHVEVIDHEKELGEQDDFVSNSLDQIVQDNDVAEATIVTEATEQHDHELQSDIEEGVKNSFLEEPPVLSNWYSSIVNIFSFLGAKNESSEDAFPVDQFVPSDLEVEQATETVYEVTSGIDEFLTESESAATRFPNGTNHVLPYLIVTAFALLFFTLGFYYLEQTKQDAKFILKINQVEKELLLSKQECLIVKEDFRKIDEELNTVNDLRLREIDLDVQELEQQNQLLQTELDAATEAGMELNRMLSKFLTSQSSTESLMKSMEQLQEQLNCQQSTMTATNAALLVKSNENEHLQAELTSSSNKFIKLENDLSIITQSLNDLLAEKTRWDEEMSKMQLLAVEAKQLEIDELCETLAARTKELSVLDECIKQMNNDKDGGSEMDVMLDVVRSKVELDEMKKHHDDLLDRLAQEEGARKLLEDHVQVITAEVEQLRLNSVQAEKEKLEANTKLEVLTNYFQEKESQLHKDLGVQEALFNQKSGDISNTYELTKSLQEQANNYKAQNEALKQEILNQERDLRDQIVMWEKKANDNWVSARQAERKLEETKQEAGHLRNLLTAEKQSTKETLNDRLTPRDLNGEVSVPSPIHLLADLPPFSPHPHIPFMPPPVPVPVQQRLHDQRPPPLGCMSSTSPAISLALPLLPPPLQFTPVTPHSASSRHHSFRPLHNNKGSNVSGGNSSDDLDRHL